MAEFKLGRIRFVWKGEWAADTAYYKDDVIRYGGKTYICVIGHTAAANFYTDKDFSPTRWNQMSDGVDWKGDWTVSTFYKVNDIVQYGGSLYLCNTSHTSAATTALGLENDLAKWDSYAEGFSWKGNWATATRYKINDIVRYGGYTYVCNTGHISASTTTLGLEDDQSSWDTFNPGFEYKAAWSGSSVRYKLNDVVKYGGGLWICTTAHTSTSVFANDESNWAQLVQGTQFEGDWSNATVYQPGDIVRYGGNQYVAKTNHSNSNPRTGTSDWDLYTESFRFQDDWDYQTAYKIGEVVRLNGYTYLATTDVPVLEQEVLSTSAVTNRITVSDTTGFVVGMMVRFDGTVIGNLNAGGTYYVQSIPSSSTFTIAATPGGSVITPTTANASITVTGATGTGTAATIYFADQGVAPFANGSSITVAGMDPAGYNGTYTVSSCNSTSVTFASSETGTFVSGGTVRGVLTATVTARPTNANYWSKLNSGIRWQGEWADDAEYVEGDVVRYGSNAYVCILAHRSEADDGSTLRTQGGGQANSRPDQDTAGTYWNVLTIGNEESVLTTRGDLVYYGGAGPTRLPVGIEGQVLRVSNTNEPEWATLGKVDHVYYVATHGVDEPAPVFGLTVDKPWKTIRYACEQILNGPRNPAAARLLEMNRAFIQRETTRWIDDQVTNNTAPFTTLFDYDEHKCERDVGIIIDSIIHDIKQGGNVETRKCALAYVNDAPEFYTLGQEAETVAAVNYALTLMGNVLAQSDPDTIYQGVGADSTLIVTQWKDATLTAETGVLDTVTSLVGVITDAITAGVTDDIPAQIKPNKLVHIKTGQYREVLPIIIPAETCLLGDETRSTNAGPRAGTTNITDSYYSVGTMSRIEAIIGDIVTGQAVIPTTGNTATQITAWPYGDTAESNTVTGLVRAIQHRIDYRLGTLALANYTDPTNYNTSYLVGYGDARKLIRENKAYFQAEVIAYVDTNYPNTYYSRTTCKRDVGYIIDALAYDLTYAGNMQSIIAGLSYYSGLNGALQFDSEEMTATLAAMAYLKTMVTGAAQNIVVGGAQTAVSQYRDTAGSVAAATLLGANLDIIAAITAGGRTAAPNITVTAIASNVMTAVGHGLDVQDKFVPRTTANGLIANQVYYVVAVPTADTFTVSASWGGSVVSLSNGTGLTITADIVDTPDTAPFATSMKTAFATLSAAEDTIIQNLVDEMNVTAWHTDFIVDATSLTSTDFRVYVGKHSLAHDYVSGGTVTKSDGTNLSMSNFVYDESTGWAVITTSTSHGLVAGDVVDITNITVSCLSDAGNRYNAVFPSAYKTDGVTPKVEYSQVTCLRDARMILEAVGYDFMADSNFQTLKAAYSYMRASASGVYSLGQKAITRAAFTVVKTQAKANVGGDTTAQDRIETLMTHLDDIVFSGSMEGSNTRSRERNVHYAARQLELNKDFVAAEVNAYIADTYSGTATDTGGGSNEVTVDDTSWMRRGLAIKFTGSAIGNIVPDQTYYVNKIIDGTTILISETRDGIPFTQTTASGTMGIAMVYDSALCLRDIRSYVDAIKYDLIYTGNYKSMMAARYYVNSVIGSLEEDMYYLRNGTGVRNQTLEGLTGDLTSLNEYGTRRVTAGAYVSLDPGWGPDDDSTWITSRSPYIQNNATFGYAAIGQKVDGALHNGGNKSVTSNDFTQLISDGIGAWITNNARAELVSVFTYYSHIGYLAENGGRIRGTNGNNSYGDWGSVAEGFDATETPNTAIVDNKLQFTATVGNVFTDGGSIHTFEFENAGTDYTEATWTILGPGLNAVPEQDEFRDGAVYQVRLLDLNNDSSGQYGGDGYLTNSNTAQGGTSTTITIAASDGELSSAYVGMKIYLTGGTGAGQYGIISAYNAGTKLANIVKESTGASGWDHVVPGSTISSPDASTTYTIEPAISFAAPTYSSTAKTLATAAAYTNLSYQEIVGSYIATAGTTEGSGVDATFDVLRKGNKYIVTLNAAGTGYARLDTIVIDGADLDGVTSTNDITITVTAINTVTGAILDFDYEGQGQGGHFIATLSGSTTSNISPDGSSWSAGGALPSAASWSGQASGKLTVEVGAGSFVTGRSYTITSLGSVGSQTDFTAIGASSNTVGVVFVATGAGSGTGVATPNQGVTVVVATGATTTAYSLDGGVNWSSGGALPSSANWSTLAYGKGLFVTVASGGTAVAYTADGGATWSSGGALPASATWTSVAYGKGRWVAIASGGTQAAYSVDNGASWTSATLPASASWTKVTWGNGRFVAIASGTDGAAYSLDGVTWTASTLTASSTWSDVSYGQGVFLAVNQAGNTANSSEDGIVWTARTITSSATGWRKAAFGNPNSTGSWVVVPSASGTGSSQIKIGARARGRAYVATNKIYAIYLFEPGSNYESGTPPTMTITDPNNTYEMPFEVRVGNGAMGNPSWVNRGTSWVSANAEQFSGDGYGDFYQPGTYVAVRRITQRPVAGSNVVFGSLPDRTFKLVNVLSFRGSNDGGYTAFFQISPALEVYEAPEHGDSITTRIRYSQVRLTGHDFLSIGTGNFVETNYPGEPTQDAVPAQETQENHGGRVFYTSTDQDGNFRVGDLFTIEQSTGIATLNADAFNIAGLQELTLGNITLGGASASINEFSTDPFFTADSDSVVPTQRAIKAYISAQIGGGGASLNVNSITAGFVFISNNVVSTTTGSAIQMNARFDFRRGVTGYPLAFNYFLNK